MKIKPHLKDELKKYFIERVKNEGKKINVFSPYILSVEEKELIKKKIDNLDWHDVEYHVDESLMAGIVIKKGSQIINLSLKGTLANLKKIVYESD